MLKVAIYALSQAIVTFYAVKQGSAPERIAAALLSIAFLTAAMLPYNNGRNYNNLYLEMMVIDVTLFLGLLVIALLSNRFWPIWVAALQLLTVVVHFEKVYTPSLLPIVYARVSGEIGYVILAALVIGTRRHASRVKRSGPEDSWTFAWDLKPWFFRT